MADGEADTKSPSQQGWVLPAGAGLERKTTHSLYEMLQTQLDGQGCLSYTTIAEHHDLVRRCESSSHCRVRKERSARGPDLAVRSCDSERLSAGIVWWVLYLSTYVGCRKRGKRERECVCW